MNHDEHFHPDKLYAHEAVNKIKVGSQILVIDYYHYPHEGVLLSTGAQYANGEYTPCFSITNTKHNYNETFATDAVDVYYIINKFNFRIILDQLTTL